MPKQTIQVMIEGGKATAAPPLGPALGPLGLNTKAIVDEINKRTGELRGMQVPVKVIVDKEKKTYEIEIGTPPVASLVKKELGIEKGSGEAGIKRAGDMTEEQVKKIARTKFGSEAPALLSQVRGTCRSMGVTIGQGAITKEELKRYEDMDRQRAEAEAAKAAGKAAAAAVPAEGAAPEAQANAESGKPAAPKAEEKPAKADEKKK